MAPPCIFVLGSKHSDFLDVEQDMKQERRKQPSSFFSNDQFSAARANVNSFTSITPAEIWTELAEWSTEIGSIDFPSAVGNSSANAGGAGIEPSMLARRFPIDLLLNSFF